MIGFFDTVSSGGIINVADIETIEDARPNQHGVPLHKVHLRGGRSFTTFTNERGGLLLRPVQITPAQPGTHIIWVDGENVWRSPVCAWALCLDGEVRPVTPNGVNGGQHGVIYVEMPCGRIESIGQHIDPPGFGDEAAMVTHFRADDGNAR